MRISHCGFLRGRCVAWASLFFFFFSEVRGHLPFSIERCVEAIMLYKYFPESIPCHFEESNFDFVVFFACNALLYKHSKIVGKSTLESGLFLLYQSVVPISVISAIKTTVVP